MVEGHDSKEGMFAGRTEMSIFDVDTLFLETSTSVSVEGVTDFTETVSSLLVTTPMEVDSSSIDFEKKPSSGSISISMLSPGDVAFPPIVPGMSSEGIGMRKSDSELDRPKPDSTTINRRIFERIFGRRRRASMSHLTDKNGEELPFSIVFSGGEELRDSSFPALRSSEGKDTDFASSLKKSGSGSSFDRFRSSGEGRVSGEAKDSTEEEILNAKCLIAFVLQDVNSGVRTGFLMHDEEPLSRICEVYLQKEGLSPDFFEMDFLKKEGSFLHTLDMTQSLKRLGIAQFELIYMEVKKKPETPTHHYSSGD